MFLNQILAGLSNLIPVINVTNGSLPNKASLSPPIDLVSSQGSSVKLPQNNAPVLENNQFDSNPIESIMIRKHVFLQPSDDAKFVIYNCVKGRYIHTGEFTLSRSSRDSEWIVSSTLKIGTHYSLPIMQVGSFVCNCINFCKINITYGRWDYTMQISPSWITKGRETGSCPSCRLPQSSRIDAFSKCKCGQWLFPDLLKKIEYRFTKSQNCQRIVILKSPKIKPKQTDIPEEVLVNEPSVTKSEDIHPADYFLLEPVASAAQTPYHYHLKRAEITFGHFHIDPRRANAVEIFKNPHFNDPSPIEIVPWLVIKNFRKNKDYLKGGRSPIQIKISEVQEFVKSMIEPFVPPPQPEAIIDKKTERDKIIDKMLSRGAEPIVIYDKATNCCEIFSLWKDYYHYRGNPNVKFTKFTLGDLEPTWLGPTKLKTDDASDAREICRAIALSASIQTSEQLGELYEISNYVMRSILNDYLEQKSDNASSDDLKPIKNQFVISLDDKGIYTVDSYNDQSLKITLGRFLPDFERGIFKVYDWNGCVNSCLFTVAYYVTKFDSTCRILDYGFYNNIPNISPSQFAIQAASAAFTAQR